MNKIHCISYASNNFLPRVKNYEKQITKFNRFNSVKIYSEQDLNSEFALTFRDILSMPRGGGYWIWKAQIIKQHLSLLDEGDVLFYTDIGCSFNSTSESHQMFDSYLKIIDDNCFLRFASTYAESEYTNSSTILFFSEKYNQDFSKLAVSKHLLASVMAFKKHKNTINFFSEYMECLSQNPNTITDAYNDINRLPLFKDHRHDQSLFSLLFKTLGYTVALADHTWGFNLNHLTNIPILTTRCRI